MVNYESSQIAIDVAIFTIKNQELLVYLERREKEPYKNWYELPGGLLLAHETAEETLVRKLNDVVGTKKVFFEQFHTFTKPGRDPRIRTVSIGFIALISEDKAAEVKNFQRVDNLPKLAFDHQEIIKKALEFLQQNIDNGIVNQFMPDFFPLNDLQMVHEVIEQKKFDNRNFRKKILSSGIVKKIKKIQRDVPHRPATLYQFSGKSIGIEFRKNER